MHSDHLDMVGTRGKKRYKYCSFSHTQPLVSCLRPSMCSYDGELINFDFSVHVLFPLL